MISSKIIKYSAAVYANNHQMEYVPYLLFIQIGVLFMTDVYCAGTGDMVYWYSYN